MKKALAGRVDQSTKTPTSAETEGVEQSTHTPGGQKTSKAKSFDETSTGSDVPDGKYEAIIKDMVYQEPDAKGRSVRFTVVFASEQVRGEEITNWFRILEPDQETAAQGAKFFKRAMAVLGYKDIKLADIEEACDEITKDNPGVLVQKKNNEGFDNVYINGLIEDSPAIRATYDEGHLN